MSCLQLVGGVNLCCVCSWLVELTDIYQDRWGDREGAESERDKSFASMVDSKYCFPLIYVSVSCLRSPQRTSPQNTSPQRTSPQRISPQRTSLTGRERRAVRTH